MSPWGEARRDASTRLRLPGKVLARLSSSRSCADPLRRTLLPASHRLFSACGCSLCSSQAGRAWQHQA